MDISTIPSSFSNKQNQCRYSCLLFLYMSYTQVEGGQRHTINDLMI